MSRSSRRRSLITVAAVLGACAAPAAAQAATYTVAAGGGPCGGADLSCESLVAAAGAVVAGDTVNVTPGTYAGATFATPGVTIAGTAAGVVVNSGLVFSGNGGSPSELRRVAVAVTSGAGPAIDVTGASGLTLADALVVSQNGHGVIFSASTANTVLRSTIATGGGASDAVRVFSDGAGDRALTIDSTIVTGGAAGLAGRSTGGAAGDIQITARHLTAAGSTNGVVLDSSQAGALLPGAGDIAMTASDSIVLNGAAVTNNPGVAGIIGANTATFTPTRTLTAGDPNTLFVNPGSRNFRLRVGSPAIDQGQITAGESATDVEGDPRSAGAAPDQGADEFVNKPPVARLAAASATVPAGRALTFTAAGSSDDVGPIKTYQWRFGDGQTAATTTPTVTHAYANEGPVSATLVVTDALDVPSAASAPVTVTVTDGTPPAVSIDLPKRNQSVPLVTRTTKTVKGKDGTRRKRTTTRRTRLGFGGRALDKSGVRSIVIALRQVSRAPTKKKKKKATSSQTTTRKCRWLDPKKGIVVRGCDKPVQITAKYNAADATWTYRLPAARRLSAGTYRLSAAGVDKAGVFGNSFKPTSVVFKLR